MFSIHKRIQLAAVASVIALAGCQQFRPVPPPQPLNPVPIANDQAMNYRTWSITSAEYANNQVNAGSTLETLVSKPANPPANTFGDPLLFVFNLAALPFAVFATPPGTNVGYKSLVTDPTYTAMPAMPPSPVPPVTR